MFRRAISYYVEAWDSLSCYQPVFGFRSEGISYHYCVIIQLR